MTLRPATAYDETLFYDWRALAEGKRHYQSRRTTRIAHARWYAERLKTATLFVWNEGAGIARVDSNGEVTVDASDYDQAAQILDELKPYAAAQYGGRLKAVVDRDDRERARALQAAGFVEFPARAFIYRA